MVAFLQHYAFVVPTKDMHFIGWVVDNKLVMLVCLNGFLGKVCQMHVAMVPEWKFTPRAMLRKVFHTAFVEFKRETVLGIVNSLNDLAMEYDQHLGFKELWRLPKMHDEGGDIVVFGMAKDDCRFLNMLESVEEAA